MQPQRWHTSVRNNSNFCAVVPELSHLLVTTPPLTMKQAHANWSGTPDKNPKAYWINISVTDEGNWYKWWITNETNMYPSIILINLVCIFKNMVFVFDWKYVQFGDIFIEIQAKTYDMLLQYIHAINAEIIHPFTSHQSIYPSIQTSDKIWLKLQ